MDKVGRPGRGTPAVRTKWERPVTSAPLVVTSLAGSRPTPITLMETHRAISAIGVDDAGELYLTDLSGGELVRLVDAS